MNPRCYRCLKRRVLTDRLCSVCIFQGRANLRPPPPQNDKTYHPDFDRLMDLKWSQHSTNNTARDPT